MSVIEAEVEVDETDIPLVQIGQPAKVTIDAIQDKTFTGKVTEIGNSPIQATGAQTGGQRTATNFKVVVTLDEPDPGRAAGLHLHGGDHDGDAQQGCRRADPGAHRPRADLRREGQHRPAAAAPAAAALPVRPDRSSRRCRRRPARSCCRVRSAKRSKASSSSATTARCFSPVKIGIAGERYFEVPGRSQGRRPRDHRAVRFGAEPVRRRSRADEPAARQSSPPAKYARLGPFFGSRHEHRSSSPSGWRSARSGRTSSARC